MTATDARAPTRHVESVSLALLVVAVCAACRPAPPQPLHTVAPASAVAATPSAGAAISAEPPPPASSAVPEPASSAVPESTPDLPWTVTHDRSFGTDFGNGVIQESSSTTTTFSRTGIDIETEGGRRGGPDTHGARHAALDPAQRDAIAAALPEAFALCGDYAREPFVPDEGWDTESLALRFGDRTCHMDLTGGEGKPAPPEPVLRLLRLLRVPPP